MTQTFSIETVRSDFDKSTTDLLETINRFYQHEFNAIPFEGSWTAGKVSEHLLKSESGISSLFDGNSKTSNRPVDEKMEMIRSIFLDFDKKLQSPEFILPTDKPKDKVETMLAFEKSRKKIKERMDSKDLSLLFTDFPFPGAGEFTGWEWIYFVTCHTIRHTRQMKRIYSIVNNLQ